MRLIYFALFVSMSKSDLKYIELIYRIIKSYGFSNNNNNGKKYIAFLRIEICMYGWRLPLISTFKFFFFSNRTKSVNLQSLNWQIPVINRIFQDTIFSFRKRLVIMQCDFKYYIDMYTNDIYWNCVFFSFI